MIDRVKISRLAFFAIAMLAPLLVTGSESSDWRKAKMKNSVSGYDVYLSYHPNGKHAQEAKSKCRSMSSGAANAGRSCDPDFPVMAYYALQSGVPRAALAGAIAGAENCSFGLMLGQDERASAVERFADVRGKIEPMARSAPYDQATTASGFIYMDLGHRVLMDASDSLIACRKGTNPWKDPTPQEVNQCSQRHRRIQSGIAQNIGQNMNADFRIVGGINDRSYRMGFWRRYYEEGRRDFIKRIGKMYKTYEAANRAMEKERDPEIKKMIEKVATRMSGLGKPTSGGWGR